MTSYIRRLVSWDKARFKDDALNLELDLVYVTERMIVMGYPAAGVEGMYRNRREDAKKFLEHRHGESFWVFNFCPVLENSYSASVFDGRVSRYPFPDHHVPPLPYFPLAVREMRAWLDGSNDRLAALHCKAGKGRSGTMACAYLLSLDNFRAPSPTTAHASDVASARVDGVVATLPSELVGDSKPLDIPDVNTTILNTLQKVLDLHTSRRMKPLLPSSKEAKQGVSIPSQRRWLFYWSLILARQAPSCIWSLPPPPDHLKPKALLTHIKLRTRELSGIKMKLVETASNLIEGANLGKVGPKNRGKGLIWASLARYDDELLRVLEECERCSREDSDLGKRAFNNAVDEEYLRNIFRTDKWDSQKMVLPFAKLCSVSVSPDKPDDVEQKVIVHDLRPLSDARCDDEKEQSANVEVVSDESSLFEVPEAVGTEQGIVLDASREVRVKIYAGQVFMGWFWFIPAFHMSQDASPSPSTLVLIRKELDFPLGIGAKIIDVEVGLKPCPVGDARPKSRDEKEDGVGVANIPAELEAMLDVDVKKAAEIMQAADD